MSSIAYITDQHMIEYHRLNGNRKINFWKPSNTKKISDFNKGDYLFFLAKGTEKGKRREKGILGYGKLNHIYTLTLTQMWSKFGTLNGYPCIEALEEAITKITKTHEIPEYLSCFLLEDVTFFQAPVYLSEIGMEISNKIESYIYIDKADVSNTSKILQLANEVGIDMWSTLFHEQLKPVFIKDAQINFINNICQKVKTDIYNRYDESRIQKYCAKVSTSNNQRMISKTEFIDVQKETIILYVPCLVNVNDFDIKLQYTIGHCMLLKSYIEMSEFSNEMEVYILFNRKIDEQLVELLKKVNIKYKEKLVNE